MRENDILFFNLHRRYLNKSSNYGGFLGIFSLAAFLNQNGFFAQSFAGQLMEGKKLIDEACSQRKVSMIGLYCDYENVTENIFLCQYIKREYHLPVIIGGPQATALNEDFIDESGCDAIVRYEGELTVLSLINYFLNGIGSLEKMKGIMFKKNDKIHIQPEQSIIENLDMLPFIDDECYLQFNSNNNELSIMTGRGCPFHCTFCHEGHHTRKVRLRSVENVLAEIEIFLNNRKHARNIYILFTDDTFTLIPQRVKDICKGLKRLREKKDFNWFCEGHVHTLYLHPEMIEYIAEAGAQRIQLGIEAGTQDVLDAYKKGSTIDEIKFVIKKCRDAGIQQIYSNIILGGAYFSKEIYLKNLEFAKELLSLGEGTVEIGAVAYWPLPETDITNNPQKYNIKIVDKEFLTSNGDFAQTETNELTRWDISFFVQDMEEELQKHMQKMLKNNEIPIQRVLKWFPQENTLKSVGRWWYCLNKMPHLLAYYNILLFGEAKTLKDFSLNEVLSAHPMRVISVYLYIEKISSTTIKLFDCILTGIEKDVLVYSTGKMSIENIIKQLSIIYNKYSYDELKNIVLNTLKKLEKEHLVVFSKY